jgi:hypothetical protein
MGKGDNLWQEGTSVGRQRDTIKYERRYLMKNRGAVKM